MNEELINERIAKLHVRIDKLQDENWNLAKEVTKLERDIDLIKRTLRTVCIETENPIHF